MATRDASHSPAAGGVAEKASSEDRWGMRGEDAIVVTTVAAPETGRDAEQPQQLTRLGCGARGEPGVRSPQESRKQCEFPSNLCRGRCGVENGRKGNRGTTVKGETGGKWKLKPRRFWREGLTLPFWQGRGDDATVAERIRSISPSPPSLNATWAQVASDLIGSGVGLEDTETNCIYEYIKIYKIWNYKRVYIIYLNFIYNKIYIINVILIYIIIFFVLLHVMFSYIKMCYIFIIYYMYYNTYYVFYYM